MRVVLVEFAWHAKKIIKDKSLYDKDIIVSLDPESSYLLKVSKISYFETYQFCNHEELWSKYKQITDQIINITTVLDEALWKTDQRFKELKWKFFNDQYYSLKVTFDQLYYYSELITKLIKKFNPTELIVAEAGEILIDERFRISSKKSIIKYLLINNKDFKNLKINFVSSQKKEKFIVTFLNNIKRFNIFINNLIKSEIKNLYYKIFFLIGYYSTKPKYLAINCFEILKYKKKYPKESKYYLHYNSFFYKNIHRRTKNKNSNYLNKFFHHLKNESNFYELIKHKNISFELIFNEVLIKLTQQIDFLFSEYKKAKSITNKIKPECIIFQSMAPYHFSNIIFRKICIDFKIPYAIWMHGGYGLTYSINTYDATDLKFCKNHISYGSFLNDLIINDKCVLKELKLHENQKIFPVGSLRFDFDNRKQKFKKNLAKNDKQTVLFLLGSPRPRNQFFFGRNREKSETSLWELHYDILCLLKKYQNKYNIIFKDYSNGKEHLWKKILEDIKADKILYISKEHTVNDLLKISDLNIIPWLSTTFFESLYFDSDIFVIDDDIFEEYFEKKLKNEIYYFKNADKLKLNLEKYLEEGNFYKCKKTFSRKYLLNFDFLDKRDQSLKTALRSIVNS